MSSTNLLRQLTQGLLDLLFPPQCVVCHTDGTLLCEACLAAFPPLHPPICQLCGRPVRSTGICQLCRRSKPLIDGIRSASCLTAQRGLYTSSSTTTGRRWQSLWRNRWLTIGRHTLAPWISLPPSRCTLPGENISPCHLIRLNFCLADLQRVLVKFNFAYGAAGSFCRGSQCNIRVGFESRTV